MYIMCVMGVTGIQRNKRFSFKGNRESFMDKAVFDLYEKL